MAKLDGNCHAVLNSTDLHCERYYNHDGLHRADGDEWTDIDSILCAEHPMDLPGTPNPVFDDWGRAEKFVTKSSGERASFEGGGVRDKEAGKPRFDLLMPERVPFEHQYLTRVAALMARGAEHYEDRNWEKFADEEALNRARSSAFRHFVQWMSGETDEDHAAAIFFNVMAAEYVKGRLAGEW